MEFFSDRQLLDGSKQNGVCNDDLKDSALEFFSERKLAKRSKQSNVSRTTPWSSSRIGSWSTAIFLFVLLAPKSLVMLSACAPGRRRDTLVQYAQCPWCHQLQFISVQSLRHSFTMPGCFAVGCISCRAALPAVWCVVWSTPKGRVRDHTAWLDHLGHLVPPDVDMNHPGLKHVTQRGPRPDADYAYLNRLHKWRLLALRQWHPTLGLVIPIPIYWEAEHLPNFLSTGASTSWRDRPATDQFFDFLTLRSTARLAQTCLTMAVTFAATPKLLSMKAWRLADVQNPESYSNILLAMHVMALEACVRLTAIISEVDRTKSFANEESRARFLAQLLPMCLDGDRVRHEAWDAWPPEYNPYL